MPTEEEAIANLGRIWAQGRADLLALTPREQAVQAWTPTSQYRSIDELEDAIRADRGHAPRHSNAA